MPGRLCRPAQEAIDGEGGGDPVPGDLTYLRTRRFAWDDVLYELSDDEVWTLLQLRYGRALKPFDAEAPIQCALPDLDRPDGSVVAYVPDPNDPAVEALRRLAGAGSIVAFCPVPGRLRDALSMREIPIEQVPNQLLAEFRRLIAGL